MKLCKNYFEFKLYNIELDVYIKPFGFTYIFIAENLLHNTIIKWISPLKLTC